MSASDTIKSALLVTNHSQHYGAKLKVLILK